MANKEPDNKKKEAIRLAQLSSLGIQTVLCTMIGYGVGLWLDKKFTTHGVALIIFLLIGIAAGFVSIFRTLSSNKE